MNSRNRRYLGTGLFLIFLGVWLLLYQTNHDVQTWTSLLLTWPNFICTFGLLLFIFGLFIGVPEMAIPAAVIAGLGAIVIYTMANDDFRAWFYMWTLIPGFVGVGQIVSGIFRWRWRPIVQGLDAIVSSAVMYVIFAWIFDGVQFFGPYGPSMAFILAGVYTIIRGFFRTRRHKAAIQPT